MNSLLQSFLKLEILLQILSIGIPVASSIYKILRDEKLRRNTKLTTSAWLQLCGLLTCFLIAFILIGLQSYKSNLTLLRDRHPLNDVFVRITYTYNIESSLLKHFATAIDSSITGENYEVKTYSNFFPQTGELYDILMPRHTLYIYNGNDTSYFNRKKFLSESSFNIERDTNSGIVNNFSCQIDTRAGTIKEYFTFASSFQYLENLQGLVDIDGLELHYVITTPSQSPEPDRIAIQLINRFSDEVIYADSMISNIGQRTYKSEIKLDSKYSTL